jgi:hypothetical protein
MGVEADRWEELLAADRLLGIDPLRDPGVVTLAGDWHSDYAFVERLVAATPAGYVGVWLIVQLGDLGVWPGPAATAYLDDVALLLEEAGAVVLFIDGNHENHPLLLSHPVRFDGLRVLRPRLYHLSRGFRWCWHGKTWLAVGGAHSIARPRLTPNVDWSPQELITADLARLATAGGPVDIMVTHDCPAGVKPPGVRDPAIGQPSELYDELVVEAEHRQLVREIVEEVRPARLIHGHYHVRYDAHLQLRVGTTCCITGLGRAGTLKGNMLVLDLSDG